jgi:hypothetical protein
MEEKRNSKGSGRKKSAQRLKLQRANLITLLYDYSIPTIAHFFNCSPSMVHVELTRQLQKKTAGFKVHEPEQVDIDSSKGAWMDSPERVSLIEWKINNN